MERIDPLAKLNLENMELITEIHDLKADLAELERQLVEAVGTVADGVLAVTSLGTELREARKREAVLRETLDEVTADLANMRSDRDELVVQVAELEGKLVDIDKLAEEAIDNLEEAEKREAVLVEALECIAEQQTDEPWKVARAALEGSNDKS